MQIFWQKNNKKIYFAMFTLQIFINNLYNNIVYDRFFK